MSAYDDGRLRDAIVLMEECAQGDDPVARNGNCASSIGLQSLSLRCGAGEPLVGTSGKRRQCWRTLFLKQKSRPQPAASRAGYGDGFFFSG